MSEPKRYTTNVGYGHEDNDGEFVLWDDYAKLKAENESLKGEVSRLKMEESKLLTFTETLEGEIAELSEDRQSLYLRSESFADQILELKEEIERLKKSNKLSIYNPETKEFETRFEEPK